MSWSFSDLCECSKKCRSKEHGGVIGTILASPSLSSLECLNYVRHFCLNPGSIRDDYGRSPLHVAASFPDKGQLLEWLIKYRGSSVNVKDYENGWTPLHRSLFYGRVHNARTLIGLKANLGLADNESLTPLDLLK